MKQISKFVLTLNLGLILLFAAASTYAVSVSYSRQEIRQTVVDNRAPTIEAMNFTLPQANVGVAGSYNKTNALKVTTYVNNSSFAVAFANFDDLATEYSSLNLTLVYPSGNPSPYKIGLNQSHYVTVTLPAPGTYTYTYRIDYNASTAGINDLLLDISGRQ